MWMYDYNDRNELTGARRYWPDWSPVTGHHFGYDYDNIGNRETASSGGDVNGWNLRTTSYTVNNLNQYTSVTTPGYEDIVGVAFATNSVTVNSGAADRKVEYFHREIAVTNGSNPVWQAVTVTSGSVSSNGGFVFPKNSQTLTYDLVDGNLTFDGMWTYEWDAENRLKAMTMTNVGGIPNAQRKKLEFAYDHMSRRVQKVVSTWNGAFSSPVTNKFVYDGWNLLAELSTSLSTLRSYLWGQDLSGTLDQAGGIGGLLMVVDHVPATDTYHFAAFDGNGNVTALVNASDQIASARYEYSAYGELLRSTGPLAMANPFRWSTKFWDEESGLVYYGYRYYNSTLGRWMGRDPVEEEGGRNLFAFNYNRVSDMVDPLGDAPLNPAWAQILVLMILINAEVIMSGNPLRGFDDEFIELSKRAMEGESDPTAPNKPKTNRPRPPRKISPTKARVLRWIQRGPWGGMQTIVTGGIVLNGAAAAGREFDNLTTTLASFGRNAAKGESAWAELDAVTFAAQLQGGGSDYFFTMGMFDMLLTVQDNLE